MRYRAALIVHTWSIALNQLLLPSFMTAAEFLVIFTLYTGIRTNSILLRIMALIISGIGYFVLKTAFEFGAVITDSSREFLKFSNALNLRKEDRLLISSSQPLTFTIGNTFTISKQTFPTISQDIILTGVVNVLVTYR